MKEIWQIQKLLKMNNHNFTIVGRLYRNITVDWPTVPARVSDRADWHSTYDYRQDKVRICPGPVIFTGRKHFDDWTFIQATKGMNIETVALNPYMPDQVIVPRKVDPFVSAGLQRHLHNRIVWVNTECSKKTRSKVPTVTNRFWGRFGRLVWFSWLRH